jgi:hypothetical protein
MTTFDGWKVETRSEESKAESFSTFITTHRLPTRTPTSSMCMMGSELYKRECGGTHKQRNQSGELLNTHYHTHSSTTTAPSQHHTLNTHRLPTRTPTSSMCMMGLSDDMSENTQTAKSKAESCSTPIFTPSHTSTPSSPSPLLQHRSVTYPYLHVVYVHDGLERRHVGKRARRDAVDLVLGGDVGVMLWCY